MSQSRSRETNVQRLTSSGVYLVTDDRLPQPTLFEKTRHALEAGTRVVQYRDKYASKRELLVRAEHFRDLCTRYGALYIVNDHLDVALAVQADGLHLGQGDLPAHRARPLLGSAPLLGLSVSTVQQAVEAEGWDVDYLGVGAMYPTDTKKDAGYGGLNLLGGVRERVSRPLVAIGGITLERVPEVISSGADAVAVVSAVYSAVDSGLAAFKLLAAIAEARSASV